MKINDLLDKIQANGLKLPHHGTGVKGRILARDLESVLGDYFARLKYPDPIDAEHLRMRRQCIPIKAYRYNHLSALRKAEVFFDNNNWSEQEKFNGWRMLITYIPNNGFRFWGGNISDIDFLPVDYTEHIILQGVHPQSLMCRDFTNYPFVLDTEALCYDEVEMLDGRVSTNTLDAVKAILGSDPLRALHLQRFEGKTLEFVAFDLFNLNRLKEPYGLRYEKLQSLLSNHLEVFQQLSIAEMVNSYKKQYLHKMWAFGKEGTILRNMTALPEFGSRSKELSIKVKRTMSGEIGHDIDAFIMGWVNTTEWAKQGLIGGVKLGVLVHSEMDEEPDVHHIATVTNMPDAMRMMLTECPTGLNPTLRDDYKDKVVVVDGQELSARNKMILHATVDWDRGFRETKRAEDCTFTFEAIDKEMF